MPRRASSTAPTPASTRSSRWAWSCRRASRTSSPRCRLPARCACSITARGGGTSLSGQSIGPGVVLDCSKYLAAILDIDPSARVVAHPARCGPRFAQPCRRGARLAVWPRRFDFQSGQPRRHDRQQLRRLALHRLRQDHRPRPPARCCPLRRQPRRASEHFPPHEWTAPGCRDHSRAASTDRFARSSTRSMTR